MPSPAPYRSKLYRDFFSIGPEEYQRMIRFFEEKEAEIGRLDGAEHFDLLLAYVEALFAVGAYRKHLLMVDLVIEAALQDHVAPVRGQAVYRRMIFRKAASSYQIRDYASADHLLRELIRIDPTYADACPFLCKVWYRQETYAYRLSRAAGVLLMVVAIGVYLLELLVVAPFYGIYADAAAVLRAGLLGAGLAAMVGGRLVAWLHAWLRSRRFVARHKARKKEGAHADTKSN